jgi:intracellular septation protein
VSARAPSPGLRAALDYAPLVVFFLATYLLPGAPCRRLVASLTHALDAKAQVEAILIARVIVATALFVLATVAVMIVSQVRLGGISVMLWISGALVVVFGGLTIWFADRRFIQMKPTIVYAILAAVLGFGLATGRPLLQAVLGTAYPGLDEGGWRKLTRNWVGFFAAMAVINELVWRHASWNAWVAYKLWGAIPLTVLFAIANVPMLLRHGLTAEADEAVSGQLPPEG